MIQRISWIVKNNFITNRTAQGVQSTLLISLFPYFIFFFSCFCQNKQVSKAAKQKTNKQKKSSSRFYFYDIIISDFDYIWTDMG